MDLMERATQILRAGGLVAFPTETVYGLGADAANAQAVARIFAAKGRPATNPLIVHLADAHIARRYARTWPDAAEELARRFWPGPLTLVLPKTPDIPDLVTAGLNSVALRVPNHPLALQLLQAFDGPVAAPSANRSTAVSPTTAQHVRDELGDRVDLILDGGPCAVGIESTVLDLSAPAPTLLRPGGVSRQQIEAVIGPLQLFHGAVDPTHRAKSPGQHSRHYAPRTLAVRFSPVQIPALIRWANQRPDQPLALVSLGPPPPPLQAIAWNRIVEMPAAPPDYAHRLYATLRDLDRANLAAIAIELPPDTPPWHALRDRLRRATRELG